MIMHLNIRDGRTTLFECPESRGCINFLWGTDSRDWITIVSRNGKHEILKPKEVDLGSIERGIKELWLKMET
jgi:hypothetical protein